MITQNGIAPFVAFRYEQIILAVEETTSANRCGSSCAAFSCPASVCPYDSAAQGIFLSLERRRRI